MNSKIAQELREIATHRMDLQAKLITTQNWQTCLNCAHWREIPMSGRTMICGLFNATPPPHIIVSGCPDHENDIPF